MERGSGVRLHPFLKKSFAVMQKVTIFAVLLVCNLTSAKKAIKLFNFNIDPLCFGVADETEGVYFFVIMAKEKETSKDGWASSFAFPAYVWPIIKALPNESRLQVFDCICRYGIEGEKYFTLDPLESGVLECAYMQMEELNNSK